MKWKEMGILPEVTLTGSTAKYGGKHSVFSSISMPHATGNTIVFPK